MVDWKANTFIYISIVVNIVLVVYLIWKSYALGKEGYTGLAVKQEARLFFNLAPIYRNKNLHEVRRLRMAKLTNIIIPFHPRQERLVIKNLQLWKHFLPCGADRGDEVIDEHPAGELGKEVDFTFFVSTETDPELEQRLLTKFNSMPKSVRQCFRNTNVKFSNLRGEHDNYLLGSRKMFELMLSGGLNLTNPSYVLYMEPDMLPIRDNWLETIDSLTRYPNSPFWIKGSIFRGNISTVRERTLCNLLHINGNAIYNMEDTDFKEFYYNMVRPYITEYYRDGAYDTDVFKFLLDISNYNYARRYAHMFQFTDAIHNMWHTDYSISGLKHDSEMIALVHGGAPNP